MNRDGWDFYVVMGADNPRADDWRRIYGGLTLPVVSPVPVWARLPGRTEDSELVFMLAWWQLLPETLEGMVRHISDRFGIPVDVVRLELEQHGVPILADGLSVVICNMGLFF